jgi:hypothetical protein
VQAYPFLADNDGADVGHRTGLDNAVDRIGEENLHPLLLERMSDAVCDLHSVSPVELLSVILSVVSWRRIQPTARKNCPDVAAAMWFSLSCW